MGVNPFIIQRWGGEQQQLQYLLLTLANEYTILSHSSKHLEAIVHVTTLYGRKALSWSEYEKPTLKEIHEAAQKEFPEVPADQIDDQMVVTLDTYNDGRSASSSVMLLRKQP